MSYIIPYRSDANESPSVYLADGTLRGLCMAFGLSFEVELRRTIRFYKDNGMDDVKFWFSIENDEFSEEEDVDRLHYMRAENSRINGLRRNMF